MKKILTMIGVAFILASCGIKSTTQSIVDNGVERIERAERIIKTTETLAQCKAAAADALLSAKVDILNAGESCKIEISNLESDLVRWKSYFWLLITVIGVGYLITARRPGNVI